MKYLVLLLVSTVSISQINDASKAAINFNVDLNNYNKIAKDSIKEIYNKQRQFYSKNNENVELAISQNYKWEDLSFYSIPIYRILREASKKYSCADNIEKYIVFEERNKYQKVLLFYKNKILRDIDVPDFNYEMDRIYNPDYIFQSFYREDKNYYINRLLQYKYEPLITEYIKPLEEKDDFFFMIFGLKDVLFQIDNKNRILYARSVATYSETIYLDGTQSNRDSYSKIDANDFIRKYIGENKIRDIANGIFLDFEENNINSQIPCSENSIQSSTILLNVTKNAQ